MSSNYNQLVYSLEGKDLLFPYPSWELTADDFSQRKVLRANEANSLQIEFRLSSPIEFTVQSSKANDHFQRIFDHKNLKFHKSKNKNLKYEYELNLKHYIYVLSKIKYLQEECYLTVNYNYLNRDFINVLLKNLSLNDNILSFIENPKSRKSIIESLEFNSEFGNSMKFMLKNKMFDNLYDNQMIAFYMSVIRDGKAILADTRGKSLSAITIMTYFRKDWPLVIICDERRKSYWFDELSTWFTSRTKPSFVIINELNDVFVYPKPFHDIMIIDYNLYYDIKDIISFQCLGIKAYIFEDQCRGYDSSSKRQWKGLSNCFDNMKNAKRILFIYSNQIDLNSCHRLYPLLKILDSNTFSDFERFSQRYCDPNDHKRDECLREFEILLKSSYLIQDLTDD